MTSKSRWSRNDRTSGDNIDTYFVFLATGDSLTRSHVGAMLMKKRKRDHDSLIFIPGREEATCMTGFPDLRLLPRIIQQPSPRLYQNGCTCIADNPLGIIRESYVYTYQPVS